MTAVMADIADVFPDLTPRPGMSSDVLGVVHPRNAQDVSRVVQWARQERVALVPRSSSSPHASPVPTEPALVVDLSAMKAIVRTDRRNRVALFEAGVTFEDLAPALQQVGLRLALPLCPRPGKSVLASYLDREPTIMPKYQWDLADPLLCLEVVFGTGDVFRTGDAAGPGTLEEQWASGGAQKGPMGPGHADWMRLVQGAQGTTGIATWGSVKAEILPEVESALLLTADTPTSVIEATYQLLRRNAVDVCVLLDRSAFGDVFSVDASAQVDVTRASGAWNLVVSVSGLDYLSQRRHDYHAGLVRRYASESGARLVAAVPGGNERLLSILQCPQAGVPWRDRSLGAHRSVWFQTTLDRAARFVEAFSTRAQSDGIDKDLIRTYVQPQLGGRVCDVEMIVACEPGSALEAQVERFVTDIVPELVAEGAFFSRPRADWAEAAFSRSPGSLRLLEKVKTIFDPDRIMAPGRLGLERNPDGYRN